MLNVKMLPLNIQSKWEREVHTGVVIEDWSFIYCIPFSVTKDTKLQAVRPRIMSFALKLTLQIFRKLTIANQKFRT
jgi:hypothetical protein